MASLEESGFGLRVYSHKSASTFKDYQGAYEAEEMKRWVMRHSLEGYLMGSVAEMSNETVMRLFDYGIPVLLYFRDVKSHDFQYYDNEIKAVFEEKQKDILFLQGDINTEIGRKIAMLAGLDSQYDEMPQVRIMNPMPGEKHVKNFEFSEEFICKANVISFIDKYLKDQL